MLNEFIPTKRLPFGFRGEWGKCYKKFVFEPYIQEKGDIVYEDAIFRDIGVDIQFKSQSKRHQNEQPIQGYLTDSIDSLVETTDSYWNDKTNRFCCCVAVGDIVEHQNILWLVTGIEEKTIFNPAPQSFYCLSLKSISLGLRRNND